MSRSPGTDPRVLNRRRSLRIALVTAGVLLVAIVGYLGFVKIVTGGGAAGSGLLVLGAPPGSRRSSPRARSRCC